MSSCGTVSVYQTVHNKLAADDVAVRGDTKALGGGDIEGFSFISALGYCLNASAPRHGRMVRHPYCIRACTLLHSSSLFGCSLFRMTQ